MGALLSPGLLPHVDRNDERGSTELNQAPGRSETPTTLRLVVRSAEGASRRISGPWDRRRPLEYSLRQAQGRLSTTRSRGAPQEEEVSTTGGRSRGWPTTATPIAS